MPKTLHDKIFKSIETLFDKYRWTVPGLSPSDGEINDLVDEIQRHFQTEESPHDLFWS